MLQNTKELYGHQLAASDGEIGLIPDFYFDDHRSAVRFLVADGKGILVADEKKGEDHASALRVRLRAYTFDHVLTSPLQRARRTCELAGFAEVAEREPDLMEWDYGEYEGLTTEEIQLRQPGWNVFHDGCPGGESVEQMVKRVDRAVVKLRSLGGVVAVFAHGHLLRALTARWLGRPVDFGQHLLLDTGSLCVLGDDRPHHGTPVISRWNAM